MSSHSSITLSSATPSIQLSTADEATPDHNSHPSHSSAQSEVSPHHSSNPCCSHSSAPSSPVKGTEKRPPYKAYLDDPTIPIPRQTADRWKKMRVGDHSSHSSCDGNEEPMSPVAGLDLDPTSPVASLDHAFNPSSPESSDTEDDLDNSGDSSYSNSDFNSDIDGSGSELSNDDNDPLEDESLYPGCLKTKDEAIYELINVYLRKKLSKSALKDIYKIYVTSLPPDNVMPSSVYNLFQYVQNFSLPLNVIEHYYCRPAMHSVVSKANPCESCGSFDIGIFYELPLENTIKFLFEQRGLANLIDEYSETRSRRGESIGDITDGSEYKRVWGGIPSKYKLTLILNTDGVSPHASSKARFWPLMFTPMEVPPLLRSSFTVVWGIWFDKKFKPDMNLYLKPFVSSLIEIHRSGGVAWKEPCTGTNHVSPIRVPFIVADAPARAAVLNMQEHQAKYACNACEQKTSKLPSPPTVPGGTKQRRKRRFLFKEEAATLRTNDRMLACGNIGTDVAPKRGIKGLTVIRDIPYLDLSTCVSADYMHCVLSGVVRQICSLWFFVKGPWYIGDHLTDINKFLDENIHPPDTVSRLPRSFEYFALLKANEFRSFLLFFSLILVAPYLKDEYHQHWMLFVKAIFLLLTESISENDLLTAEALLRLFVRDIGTLYGDEQFVYNVHQLLHLVLYVRRWGCLWSNSAFTFEGMNGTLSDMIHGSKNEGRELVNQLSLAQGNQMIKNKIVTDAKKNRGLSVLGKPVQHVLTELELNCLQELNANMECLEFYGRILVGRETFSSQDYDKNFRRRNSYVEIMCDGRKLYGRIIVFCKSGDSVFCIVSIYQVDHTKFFFHRATLTRIGHIIPVEESGHLVVCKAKDIVQKLIQVGNFLCVRPNCIEVNL